MSDRAYYHAYDDRYRQVHEQNLQWFSEEPASIVGDIIRDFAISRHHKLLEIGCGEGQDARRLLAQGFDLLATDVSAEAIRFCRERAPVYADRFQVLDCVADSLDMTFDFIYAVAVVHMLVADADRDAFYRFIREHLNPDGVALICTMGDGLTERQTEIGEAFELRERVHSQTGKTLRIAATTCRMVSFQTFDGELARNGLSICRQGVSDREPGFSQMMYAVVKKG